MILAQVADPAPVSRMEGIQHRFAGGGSLQDLATYAVGLIVVLGACWLLRCGWRRMQRARLDSPRRLFNELLTGLRVPPDDRQMLTRIAGELRLHQPAELLLSPSLFRLHANLWMSSTGQANDGTASRLRRIESALFDPGAGQLVN